MLQEGVEWFGDASQDVIVTVVLPGDCVQIRQEIADATSEITALRELLVGLDPRNVADQAEIRRIRRLISEREQSVALLSERAQALGCPCSRPRCRSPLPRSSGFPYDRAPAHSVCTQAAPRDAAAPQGTSSGAQAQTAAPDARSRHTPCAVAARR